MDGGIPALILPSLDPITEHERGIRDSEATRFGPPPAPDWDNDFMAVHATMQALDLQPDHVVLELGPGTGRFTRLLAGSCAALLGVDISRAALNTTAAHLDDRDHITFVQADATTPVAAPGRFDRILGTLTSNLPNGRARAASYRWAARALKPDGRFVFTTHHYGPWARLMKEPRRGRYSPEGIYRRLLTPKEVRSELAPFFGRVRVRPVYVVLPFSRRLRLHGAKLDRLAQRLPGLRAFGDLLLVEAEIPKNLDSG